MAIMQRSVNLFSFFSISPLISNITWINIIYANMAPTSPPSSSTEQFFHVGMLLNVFPRKNLTRAFIMERTFGEILDTANIWSMAWSYLKRTLMVLKFIYSNKPINQLAQSDPFSFFDMKMTIQRQSYRSRVCFDFLGHNNQLENTHFLSFRHHRNHHF